ncbi:CU044_5270 family protein [Spirillospora sp. CA-255316]
MNELDALRQMRTELAREEHPDRIALRTNWRAGVAEAPRRRGLKLPLVSLAATAAVVAGAVAVVSLPSDEAPAPGPSGTTVPRRQGDVLLVAATNAEKAPTGKYWHTRTVMGEIYAVGPSRANHYKVDSRQGNELWVDRNGKGRQAHIDFTDVPVTAQDRQKWQAAGSPTWVKIPNSEGSDAQMLLHMSPQPGTPSHWMPADDRYFGLTQKQIAGLPTEPKALENALLGLKGHWRAVSADGPEQPMRALKGQERVRALSEAAGDLLSRVPAPPAVRAAAFRMLAAQPGVKAEGETTDPLGRKGTVVSLPLKTTVPLGLFTAPKQLGTYRRQFIVDPDKGRLLAIRDLVATPPKGSRKLPTGDDGKPRSLKAEHMPDRFHRPGELAAYEVFEITEWTDREPPQ